MGSILPSPEGEVNAFEIDDTLVHAHQEVCKTMRGINPHLSSDAVAVTSALLMLVNTLHYKAEDIADAVEGLNPALQALVSVTYNRRAA